MTSTPTSAMPVRVASVPATHVYVRRLADPRVARLVDPSGDDQHTPCFLDPRWWQEAGEDRPDVLHVHFGFEYHDPAQLARLTATLDRLGVPLVYTVHDLRNPNHASPDLHDAGLDVLVPAATELVTLTDGAERTIQDRWGRRATVLPHPHVAGLDRVAAASGGTNADGPYRLVLHFKSLRANMVGAPLLRAVAEVAREREDLRLQVHLHCDVVSPSGDNHDAPLVTLACDLADEGVVDLRVHPYLPHEDLLDLVEGADGFVLPYVFGTHSGLLELCRDLGTAVIAPSCGGYADQGARHVFPADEQHGLDVPGLRRAVHEAVDAGPTRPVSATARRVEREYVAESYVRLYERARGAAVRRGQAVAASSSTRPSA